MKIDWKRKLSSRKFWMALSGLVAALLLAFGAEQNTVSQVTACITAAASVAAYILGESLVDAAGARQDDEDE